MSRKVLSGNSRDKDYVVRRRAFDLLKESGADTSGLEPGKVGSGHDWQYWKKMSRLSSSKNPRAIVHCEKGPITLELFATDAQMTVNNFIVLAKKGYFDKLTFMRVVPNFVVQGGDPRNDMNGGPGYQIRCEINSRRYETGSLGMALSGKDTGGSQFFITHAPQPHLDGGYTCFGKVVDGMELLSQIARGEPILHVEIVQKEDVDAKD
jgi:cyclophilin family peptidyl-prolyl cis-trans isomerase